MATKKYIVRNGFVTTHVLRKADGSIYEKRYEGGEEVALSDEDADLHRHKLEYADQKDRDAEEKAERARNVAAARAQHPVELVSQLAEALSQQIAGAPVKS